MVKGASFIAISSFSNSSFAVTSKGEVLSWGTNAKGRQGLDNQD